MATDGLPSGTVTFLLTDVEGSTRLWERDPAIAAVVVPRHRELIGAAVAAWRGERPLEQGEGDNVVAAFARATDAVAAAHAAQRALAEEPWPPGGTVRVRMAVHTGEVEVQPDGTYAGAVLNRCARLRALAHGGQVLVSGATADLAAEQLDPGLALVDLGAHRLRDLSRPEHVWQLAGPGLDADHPPLRSLDALPNNLPIQLSSFVGREDDIAQGVTLLGQARLLTLTGAGGCGKTRLAQRIAGEVVDRFPGGTWWVELAPLTDPGLVADAVADAIGLRLTGERPSLDVVTEHLAEYPALVVLDNCEHLVEAAAALADHLLRASSGSVVLGTSREPLNVEGEVTWRVPSLSVPTAHDVEPAVVEQYDAVRLFIDRAVQARPNFRVDNANAPAVAQICHRLDGIPLAIELAAPRCRSLPPERIATELDDRFRLLAGGSRVALPRQQTLFASVDWSHELLDPAERALLRRLAVFVGGFALDAAEAVAAQAPLDAYDVLDVLGRLVDKSLVQADEVGGGIRYRLLETIRQYGADRLAESGEGPATRNRHLAWATGFVAGHEAAATNAHTDALDALDGEHANLRAALDWALASGDVDAGLHLVGLLGVFWAGRGHYAEAHAVVPRVLDAAPADASGRARARWAGAYVQLYGGDFAGSFEQAELALREATAAGDDATRARCLHTVGTILFAAEPVRGRERLLEAAALARTTGDGWCEADAVQMAGYAYIAQGLFAEAEPHLRESAALARAAGNDFQLAWHHLGVAYLAAYAGDIATAEAAATTGIALGRRIGDPAVESFCATSWGRLLGSLGRLDELRAVIADLTGTGRQWGLNGDLLLAGIAAQARAHDDPAAVLAELTALADAMAEAGVVNEAVALWGIAAGVAVDSGRPEEARRLADLVEPHEQFVFHRAGAALTRAIALRAEGDERADEVAHGALAVFAEHGHVLPLPQALALLGGLAVDGGSAVEGARLLAAGDAIGARLGRRRSPAEQAGFDADVDAARTALGAGFEAAWDAGGALGWPDAVAYARRARGERCRPSFGWAALTPTEQQVVDLVADGLSNPQVADRLLMGRETVKTHVSNAFGKLGVSNRAELAGKVAGRRSAQPGP